MKHYFFLLVLDLTQWYLELTPGSSFRNRLWKYLENHMLGWGSKQAWVMCKARVLSKLLSISPAPAWCIFESRRHWLACLLSLESYGSGSTVSSNIVSLSSWHLHLLSRNHKVNCYSNFRIRAWRVLLILWYFLPTQKRYFWVSFFIQNTSECQNALLTLGLFSLAKLHTFSASSPSWLPCLLVFQNHCVYFVTGCYCSFP